MTEPKSIRVCLVCRYFSPTLAGAAERFRRYAPGLRARGVHLEVATIQPSDTAAHEIIDDIPVHRVELNEESQDASAALLKETLTRFRETGQWPDVLHLLNHSLRATPHVWYARLLGIPSLYTFTVIPVIQQALWQRMRVLIHRRLSFGPFNSLTVSSKVVAQRLTRQGIPAKRMGVIPNGVDLERFRPAMSSQERAEIRRQLGFELGDRVILFVGNVIPRKGVDSLVAAWPSIIRQQPKARLVLVGPRYEHHPKVRAYYSELYRMMEDFPERERICFAGAVSNVEEYMRSADVFAFPSRREGMGNVVLEAMATGLSCVLTPYEGLPAELGEPGREFLLVSHDPDMLAATIGELLEDKVKRTMIGRSARIWAEKHLDVEESLDRYARTYQMLAALNRRRERSL